MAKPWSVRIAGVDDAAVVGVLLFDFNTEFDTPTPAAAEFALRFRRLLGLGEILVLLAESLDGESVGFAYLTFRPTPYFDGPIAQLEELYVRPAARDRGAGTTLITEAVQQVRARNAREMFVNVDEVDTDARRFYERHGFSNIEPGETYRMLCYLREITPAVASS